MENTDIYNSWIQQVKEYELTEKQTLGLAYYNAVLPTILSDIKDDPAVLHPLKRVLGELDKNKPGSELIPFIAREFYFAGSVNNKDLTPFHIEGAPDDFFTDKYNAYPKVLKGEFGFFKKSSLTLQLLGNLGNLLQAENVHTVKEAFERGFMDFSFILETNIKKHVLTSVVSTNSLPDYIAIIIEIIPNPSGLSSELDTWVFSKILYSTMITEFSNGNPFVQWLWNFHNYIFYINNPDNIQVKPEWDLLDSSFETNMLEAIVKYAMPYYKEYNITGTQEVNLDKDAIQWKEFFERLNKKLNQDFKILSPKEQFRNRGEYYNYLAYVYIAAVQVILEF